MPSDNTNQLNISGLAVVPVSDGSSVTQQDSMFLQNVQAANLTEVAEGQTALKNTSDIVSREFARWMIGDHTGFQAQVSSLSQQLGVTVPNALAPNATAELNQLAALQDGAFDQAYAQDGVAAHQGAVALFQQEISSGSNPSVVSLARQGLPIIQAHLQQAQFNATKADTSDLPPVAPPQPPGGSAKSASLSTQDQDFVNAVGPGGAAEIKEGAIAVAKGTAATKEFGRWMYSDHSANAAALQMVGQQEGFSVPTDLSPDQQNDLANLQNTAPDKFESVYSSAQVLDHANTLMVFIKEEQNGTDTGLVAFAKTTLPVLEQHFAGALELSLHDSNIAVPKGDQVGGLVNTFVQNLEQGQSVTTALNALRGSLPSVSSPSGSSTMMGNDPTSSMNSMMVASS